MRFALGVLLLFTLAFFSTNAGYLGKREPRDFSCEVCLNFANNIIEKFVANDEDAVLETLVDFCREYGGNYASTCEAIVTSQIDVIMDYIRDHQEQAAEEICTAATLCD